MLAPLFPNIQDVQTDARLIRSQADRLESYERGPQLSWQSHSAKLDAIKGEVNDMGRKLCRLETIRRTLAPWQQAEVDRIAGVVPRLASETRGAILFGGDHQHTLWLATYEKYTDSLYNQSSKLANSINEAVKYARVSKDYREVSHELGLPAAS